MLSSPMQRHHFPPPNQSDQIVLSHSNGPTHRFILFSSWLHRVPSMCAGLRSGHPILLEDAEVPPDPVLLPLLRRRRGPQGGKGPVQVGEQPSPPALYRLPPCRDQLSPKSLVPCLTEFASPPEVARRLV